MNAIVDRKLIPVFLALLLALALVAAAGCGGGSNDYPETVLAEWSKLEGSTETLVEAGDSIEDETDLENLSDDFSEVLDAITSFEDKLADLKAPSDMEASDEALGDFLSAYDEYLASTVDLLDEVTGGNLDADVPDFEALVDEAQGALEDYQDSQDYNQARLDDGVWEMGDLVLGALAIFYGGEDPDDPKFDEPLQVLDDYYIYFNQGDGESMYSLLDITSPIASDYSYEFFLVQVGEAYDGGLRAEGTVDGIESYTTDEGNWVTVYMTVDYTETVDMEGNPVPAYTEEVVVDLLQDRDLWYIFDIASESGLW